MKTLYSYRASHEQFTPSELLKLAVSIEVAGSDGIPVQTISIHSAAGRDKVVSACNTSLRLP